MAGNYYRTLGVAPYSEDVVIQAAYRALMRRYHPDTNSSPDAKQRAAEINEAYEVLSNPSKRTRYDAELKAAQTKRNQSGRASSSERTKQKSSGGSPPPPPPKYQKATQTAEARRITGTSSSAGWIAGAVILGLIGLSAAFSNSRNQNYNLMNVDENLTTESLFPENTAEPAEMNAVEAPKPAKLSDEQQSPVQFDDVENAAARFASILMKSGIAGARSTSEQCHKDVLTSPTWAAADRCAAFDFAAAYIDKGVTAEAGWQPLQYFQFQAENQIDRYQEAGADAFSVSTRLTTIKASAEHVAEEALRAELARRTLRQQRIDRQSTTAVQPATDVQNVVVGINAN